MRGKGIDALIEAEQILASVGVAPTGTLSSVMPGDKVRVTATVQYKGPAYTDTFYAAIGEWRGVTWPTDIGYFDEIWEGSSSVSFSATNDWATYTLKADIPITEIGLFPWTPGLFDLYAKLSKAGILTPRYDNVIEIMLKPQFQNFVITDYSKV